MNAALCQGPGHDGNPCGRPAKYKLRTLCKTHYEQLRTGRELTPIRESTRGQFTACRFVDAVTGRACQRPLSARGWCALHYDQRRHGRPLRVARSKAPNGANQGPCAYPGCAHDRRSAARGLCVSHYRRGVGQYVVDAIFQLQNGECGICQSTDPGPRGWHLDHFHGCTAEHDAGMYCKACIRGLLCHNCNVQGVAWYESIRGRLAAVPVLDAWLARRIHIDGDPFTPEVLVGVRTDLTLIPRAGGEHEAA